MHHGWACLSQLAWLQPLLPQLLLDLWSQSEGSRQAGAGCTVQGIHSGSEALCLQRLALSQSGLSIL